MGKPRENNALASPAWSPLIVTLTSANIDYMINTFYNCPISVAALVFEASASHFNVFILT